MTTFRIDGGRIPIVSRKAMEHYDEYTFPTPARKVRTHVSDERKQNTNFNLLLNRRGVVTSRNWQWNDVVITESNIPWPFLMNPISWTWKNHKFNLEDYEAIAGAPRAWMSNFLPLMHNILWLCAHLSNRTDCCFVFHGEVHVTRRLILLVCCIVLIALN